MATAIIVNKNTGWKTSKIKWLFESRYFSCFKCFIGLDFDQGVQSTPLGPIWKGNLHTRVGWSSHYQILPRTPKIGNKKAEFGLESYMRLWKSQIRLVFFLLLRSGWNFIFHWKTQSLFSLNHCSDRLLLSWYFEQGLCLAKWQLD